MHEDEVLFLNPADKVLIGKQPSVSTTPDLFESLK